VLYVGAKLVLHYMVCETGEHAYVVAA